MLIVVVAVPLFDPPGFAVAVVAVAVAAAFSSYQMVAESIQNASCEQHYGKWFE